MHKFLLLSIYVFYTSSLFSQSSELSLGLFPEVILKTDDYLLVKYIEKTDKVNNTLIIEKVTSDLEVVKKTELTYPKKGTVHINLYKNLNDIQVTLNNRHPLKSDGGRIVHLDLNLEITSDKNFTSEDTQKHYTATQNGTDENYSLDGQVYSNMNRYVLEYEKGIIELQYDVNYFTSYPTLGNVSKNPRIVYWIPNEGENLQTYKAGWSIDLSEYKKVTPFGLKINNDRAYAIIGAYSNSKSHSEANNLKTFTTLIIEFDIKEGKIHHVYDVNKIMPKGEQDDFYVTDLLFEEGNMLVLGNYRNNAELSTSGYISYFDGGTSGLFSLLVDHSGNKKASFYKKFDMETPFKQGIVAYSMRIKVNSDNIEWFLELDNESNPNQYAMNVIYEKDFGYLFVKLDKSGNFKSQQFITKDWINNNGKIKSATEHINQVGQTNNRNMYTNKFVHNTMFNMELFYPNNIYKASSDLIDFDFRTQTVIYQITTESVINGRNHYSVYIKHHNDVENTNITCQTTNSPSSPLCNENKYYVFNETIIVLRKNSKHQGELLKYEF